MARTTTRLSTAQKQLLEAAATAASERDEANANYSDAVMAAYAEGVPVSHLARSANLSPESMRRFIDRRLQKD